jgi:hypothetical protein
MEKPSPLDELNEFLRVLSLMEGVGIRRKIVALERYIKHLKDSINGTDNDSSDQEI